ncbi:MAG: hypothetical protein N2379_10510 [Verrucomicrobiae bacterium]|nr:hypothetical protein [Verrucomicrobiae bacterium]
MRILTRLKLTPNRWVNMPELARAGSGTEYGFCIVHSRISDLRRMGYVIEAHTARGAEVVLSWYRIRECRVCAAPGAFEDDLCPACQKPKEPVEKQMEFA